MRKLVNIKTITNIEPIDNADFIVLATINEGWKVVTKKGEFKIGDNCVYFEIDSILPENDARFNFLMKDVKNLTTENGTIVRGVKLKTIKLKGKLSQGLALPVSLFPEIKGLTNDDDLDAILGIQKYEEPLPIDQKAKGNFPSFIPKTHQERIQNCINDIDFSKYDNIWQWEITKKYDGISATYYYNDGKVGMCSRNLELKIEDYTNNYWFEMNKKYQILEQLKKYCEENNCNLAIQGEIYGLGIQDNPYNLYERIFAVFDIYDIDKKCYLPFSNRRLLIKKINSTIGNAKQVIGNASQVAFMSVSPDYKPFVFNYTLDNFLQLAEDFGGEGLVFKLASTERISFKVINNNYLLKGK